MVKPFSYSGLQIVQVSPELEIRVVCLLPSRTSNFSTNIVSNRGSNVFIEIWIQTSLLKFKHYLRKYDCWTLSSCAFSPSESDWCFQQSNSSSSTSVFDLQLSPYLIPCWRPQISLDFFIFRSSNPWQGCDWLQKFCNSASDSFMLSNFMMLL